MMSTRDARWEIVRTNAGHHVRYRASNGRIVLTSEVYTRRERALRAIELVVGPITTSPFADWPEVAMHGQAVEVRDVDERGLCPCNEPNCSDAAAKGGDSASTE